MNKTGYDKHGNITGLKRYGQTGQSSYGLIDDLSLTYTGNQLKKVTDSATSSAYANGFEFKDGVNLDTEYSYDEDGNLTKDLNKNISDIQYNFLNLPRRIQFKDGSEISYLYSADGTKLQTTHIIAGNTTTTDYCGNVIYENGSRDKLLTEQGYFSIADKKFHYYIQDHQGNNRVVASQDGMIEEVNHYYPFGGIFASNSSVQPFKYNGKELDTKNGLNLYDYGARQYDPVLGRWHTMDLMTEKYYKISPYTYCLNNPILLVDPNGMWPTWGGISRGLSNVFKGTLSFTNGAARAMADNILLGQTSLRETGIYSNASAYNAGQDVGDIISIFAGAAEIVNGFEEAAGGMALSPETAGISLGVTAKGVYDITHGSLMGTSGFMKLFSKKGRVSEGSNNGSGYSKSSGKNEKHSNIDKRQQAANDYSTAKEKYDNLKSKTNKTAKEKKELETLKKQRDHYKKQMDYAGDHDHQRGRGGN